MKLGRRDLGLRAIQSFNSWAAGTLRGHTDRLIPVALIDMGDADWAVRELTRMRQAGSRAFQVRPEPVGETKSLAHPDFNPVWSAAEDLGMAAIFHIEVGQSEVKRGWFFNGEDPSHYGVLCTISGDMAPQIALSAMAGYGSGRGRLLPSRTIKAASTKDADF